jgi:AraC family transcriptional regulator
MQLGKICAGKGWHKGPSKAGWAMANDTERRLMRVLDYIYDNPSGDLSLDALSDVAAMSRFHWHRIFRAVTGETLAQAVRRIRLDRASFELAMTDTPIATIAAKVGMTNLASFRRSFADRFHMTPAAFRKRRELRPALSTQRSRITLMHPVTIQTAPAMRLAAIAHKGPYFEISRAFQKLSAVMTSRDLFAHAGRMVGVFYDDPNATEAADLRSHAAFEITGATEILDPLVEVTLPAGRQAVLTYTGPYAGLPAAYDQLFGVWLPASGEEPADAPSFEVYLNSPMDSAPEELVTKLHLPLK